MTINEDRTIITLDIPLGTDVYSFKTNCNNTCYRNASDNMEQPIEPELTAKTRAMNITCNGSSPCHVLFMGAEKTTIDIHNFSDILPLLNTKYFLTFKDAYKAGIALVMKNRQLLDEQNIPYGKKDKHLIKTDYIHGVRTPESIALGRKIDAATEIED